MYQICELNTFQNPFYFRQSLFEISTLLQNNLAVVMQLQKRLNTLIVMNNKLINDKAFTQQNITTKTSILQETSPEQRIIERLFFKKEFTNFLIMKKKLRTPLFKDRNFNITVELVNSQYRSVANKNNVTLQMKVYQVGQSIEAIQENKLGQPILKGNTTVDLNKGIANFSKISIKQVSSKYQRGLITIVIYVKSPPFQKLQDSVDYREIRPLVIKDILVRAKKI